MKTADVKVKIFQLNFVFYLYTRLPITHLISYKPQLRTEGTRTKHVERQIEELREKHQQENDFWVKEKGDLLRRLAEMRKLHLRDVRRIDDVLAAVCVEYVNGGNLLQQQYQQQ